MVVALVALVLAAGGFAIAAIPSADGTIHGCYKKDGGALRVVNGAGGCRAGERALSWNRGVAKVTVRRATMIIHLSCTSGGPGFYNCNGSNSKTVPCKRAERATGGGYGAGNAQSLTIKVSKPFPEAGRPTGWTVSAQAFQIGSSPTAPDATVPIYVVCAN
jgi:hypothetical protein